MLAAPRADRIESIDVLRGIAVLGILMMNVQAFAMVFQAYANPIVQMDFTAANRAIWFAAHVFFEMKFITVFSALFGAGIVLMVGEVADSQAVKLHYRRMGWLLLIGMIHAYLIWFGDILVPYAVWGMVAVTMRRWPARRLLIWGLALLAVSSLFLWGYYESLGYMSPETLRNSFAPTPAMVDVMTEAQQAGGWQRLAANAADGFGAQFAQLTFFAPRILSVMLLGMALYKWGFLTARWSARSYCLGAILTLPVGLGADIWGALHHIRTDFAADSFADGAMANILTSPLTAFGYVCLVMLACKAPVLSLIRKPFAAVGKMALTHYLMHSAIGFFIFAGPPGLGQFGQWERVQQFQLVLAVWVFQLVFSMLWLSAFRFGPMEWVWRSLTYGRFQPMRRAVAAA